MPLTSPQLAWTRWFRSPITTWKLVYALMNTAFEPDSGRFCHNLKCIVK